MRAVLGETKKKKKLSWRDHKAFKSKFFCFRGARTQIGFPIQQYLSTQKEQYKYFIK